MWAARVIGLAATLVSLTSVLDVQADTSFCFYPDSCGILLNCNKMDIKGTPSGTTFYSQIGGCLPSGTTPQSFYLSRVIGNPVLLKARGLLGDSATVTIYYSNKSQGDISIAINGQPAAKTLKPAFTRKCMEVPPPTYELCVNEPRWAKEEFKIAIEALNWPLDGAPGTPDGEVEPAINVLSASVGAAYQSALHWMIISIECPPPVLFVHGWNGSASIWNNWKDYMEETIGLPYDATLELGKSYSLHQNASDIVLEMNKMKLAYGTDQVSLVGHSKGGLASRLVASAHPERVRNVTTLASPHLGTPIVEQHIWSSQEVLLTRAAQQAVDNLLWWTDAKGPGYAELGPTFMTRDKVDREYQPSVTYRGLAGKWDGSFSPLQALIRPELVGLREMSKMLTRMTEGPPDDDPFNDGVVPLKSAKGCWYCPTEEFDGDSSPFEATHSFLPRSFFARAYAFNTGGFAHTSKSRQAPELASTTSMAQLETAAGILIGAAGTRDSVFSGDSCRVTCIVYTPDSTSQVAVRMPGVGWVDSVRATTDTSVVFGRGVIVGRNAVIVSAVAPGSGYLVYDVHRPAAAGGDSSAFVAMAYAEGGADHLGVGLSSARVAVGESVVVTIDGAVACSTCVDSVRIVTPNGELQVVGMRDDGVWPDDDAFDGKSHGQSPGLSEPGAHGLVGERTCVDELGQLCRRTMAATTCNVVIPPSETEGSEEALTGQYGHFVALEAKLPVDMPGDGHVQLFARLVQDTTIIARAVVDTVLDEGTGLVKVQFPGNAIHDAGLDGPYVVHGSAEVEIDGTVVDVDVPSLETAAYSAALFAHEPMWVRDSISWIGIDDNANGLYDRLVVRVPITTEVTGTYTAVATLSDSLGNSLPSLAVEAEVDKGDSAVFLHWPGRSVGAAGEGGSLVVRDFYTHVPLYNESLVSMQMDTLGTLSGLDASEFEGYVASGDRATAVNSAVTMCPSGDIDSLRIKIKLPIRLGASSDVGDHAVYAVRTETTGGSVVLWKADGSGASAGDTMWVTSVNNADTTVTVGRASGSGCGSAVWQCFVDGHAVGALVGVGVRSVDGSALGLGAVDRFDVSNAVAALGVATGGCWDLNASGGVVSAADTAIVRAHLGHHVARQYVWPMGTLTYAPGDTVRIGWRNALGDSALVTIRAIRGVSSDTTLIVADRPDSGSYVWTVPNTLRPATNYKIQMLHSAGRYQADYRNLGLVASDTTITIRPKPATGLAVSMGRYSAALSWVEPGQAGGHADAYDIRYLMNGTLSETNWDDGNPVSGEPSPGSSTEHCIEIDSLKSCKLYSFGIRTWDNGAPSVLSVVNGNTTCSGYTMAICDGGGVMVSGGGGGGEEGASALEPASTLGEVQAVGVPSENSLLWWDGSGREVTDLQRIAAGAQPGPSYPVAVREIERRRTQIDQVRLGAVDHASSRLAIAGAGQVVVGTPGSSLTAQGLQGPIRISSETPYVARSGEVLEVGMGRSTTNRALVLETRRPLAGAKMDSLGIRVERQLPDGSWVQAAVVHPRREFDKFAIPAQGSPAMRVTFLGSYPIRAVEALEDIEVVTPTVLTLADASHSRLGTVSPAIRDTGDTRTTLVPGDNLALEFTATEIPAGMVRSLFLTAKGSYEKLDGEESFDTPADRAVADEPILEFSLGAAFPNPSDGIVTIAYTLARQVPTVLRVYNVAGREVRTLIDQEQSAGRREALWDGRDNGGRKVSSGVYFYRLRAGGWQSERKLIVIQ